MKGGTNFGVSLKLKRRCFALDLITGEKTYKNSQYEMSKWLKCSEGAVSESVNNKRIIKHYQVFRELLKD